MPSERVRTTPDQWKRIGPESQESRAHRVHAQKDLVADAWRFVAVRKGDGIHECKLLGTFDTAKEARAVCEADEYEFHWPEQSDARLVEVKALGLRNRDFWEAHEREKQVRKETRKARRNDKRAEARARSWKK